MDIGTISQQSLPTVACATPPFRKRDIVHMNQGQQDRTANNQDKIRNT